MRIALLADIHANREAFEAVLAAISGQRIDRIALLGDIVGYGADPVFCVETAQALVADGALAVLGNHDAAIEGSAADMNAIARQSAEWTRLQLDEGHRAFLRTLPETCLEGEVLLVHACARAPRAWTYITGSVAAERAIRASQGQITIVGHVHSPHLWRLAGQGQASGMVPVSGTEIPLAASQSWLAVMGAVGQPRDGFPAAAYGILDTNARSLTFQRAPYDHFKASRKVRDAGLPEALADRLLRGR